MGSFGSGETGMTNSSDMKFFRDPDLDKTVGLVFELAAQLHVERQRRIALENLLEDKCLVTAAEMEALTDDSMFLETARNALDESLRKMMRILTERGNEMGPLRAEALVVK